MTEEEKAKLEAQNKLRETIIYYKNVFGSEDGKKVLEDMEAAAGMNRSNFVTDPHELAFREGGRAFVIRVKQLINYDLEHLDKEVQRQSEGEE